MDDLKTHWRKVSMESYYPIALAHECVIVLIHLSIMAMSVYAPSGVYVSNVIVSGIAIISYWFSVLSRFDNLNQVTLTGKGDVSRLRLAYSIRAIVFLTNIVLFIYNVVVYA